MTRFSGYPAAMCLALMLSLGMALPVRGQSTLTVSSTEVSPGQLFEVSLGASDLTGLNVTAFNAELTYDPAKLTVLSVSIDGTLSGPDAAGMTLLYNNNTPGALSIVAAGVKAVVGAGPLARVHLQAGATTGEVTLGISSVMLNEGDPAAQGVAGTITIRPLMYGDVSQNGTVTAYDASQILQHTSEITVLSGPGLEAADVSANGSVSAYDAALILQYVAGSAACFPSEGGCVLKRAPGEASMQLEWSRPRVEGDGMAVDLLAHEVSGDVLALGIDLPMEGLTLREIVGRPGTDRQMAYRVEDGTLRIRLASAGGINADTLPTPESHTLLTLRFFGSSAGLGDLPVATVQVNEQPVYDLAFTVGEVLPAEFQLDQNYPNPFNPTTRISYSLTEASPVRLEVFDLLGRSVRLLVDARQPAGRHDVAFEAGSLPGGIYLYRIQAGEYSETRQMVLVK